MRASCLAAYRSQRVHGPNTYWCLGFRVYGLGFREELGWRSEYRYQYRGICWDYIGMLIGGVNIGTITGIYVGII